MTFFLVLVAAVAYMAVSSGVEHLARAGWFRWRAGWLERSMHRRLERAERDKAAFMARRGFTTDAEYDAAFRAAEERENQRNGHVDAR